jgi:hypothetical protein
VKRETYRDLLAKAKLKTERREDGEFDEEDLKANLAKLRPPINLDEENLKWAKDVIDHETKPRTTKPTGQLRLPGLELYDYEPDRLIRNDNGRVSATPPGGIASHMAASDHGRKRDTAARIRGTT